MNATEARTISTKSRPNLITTCFSKRVNLIKTQIESSAKRGHYATGVRFAIPWNIRDEVVRMVVSHFQELGFQVEYHQLSETDLFIFSWI